MNILITGIHGFVGSNLLQTLHSHHNLYGLDIVSPQSSDIVKTFRWDTLQDIPPVNTIIHLAGKAHDTKNASSAQSYFDINLGLTQNIFDYFLRSQAEKFIFFSSVKAVADTVQGKFLTEEAFSYPKTPYGQSKLAAEQYIAKQYASWSKDNDQPTANSQQPKAIYIFRPAMIHGPGNKGNLNLLFNVVAKGIPWPLGAFHNERSLVSINNLTYIIQQFIEKDIPSGTYNIADDYPVSTNEIIQLMARSMNKNPGIWKLPKPTLQHLAHLGDLLHLPLNSERLKKLTESYIVSNQKLKNTLQIQILPIDPKDGLLRTFESFNKSTKRL